MELSVIIPAFNEEKRLPHTIDRVTRFLKESGVDYELIVVDDGSWDRSKDIIEERKRACNRIRLISNETNRGKGFSVKRGVEAAGGDAILFTDADLSTPIEEYRKLKGSLDDGYDVVIGSRRV
ncbi:MAG: glycosyltransferase, partial [Deltaproteobacteria bacterium]|nr:glycosyltransferase [Deltaproteobacteria bacterium]